MGTAIRGTPPPTGGGEITYGETAMFVGHSHIISVRHVSARTHRALRDRRGRPFSLMHGVDYFLQRSRFRRGRLFADGQAIEEECWRGEPNHRQFPWPRRDHRIFSLRRDLIRFQRVLGRWARSRAVRASGLPCVDSETRPYFATCSTMSAEPCDGRRPSRGVDSVSSSALARAAADRQDTPNSPPGRRSSPCRPRSPAFTG